MKCLPETEKQSLKTTAKRHSTKVLAVDLVAGAHYYFSCWKDYTLILKIVMGCPIMAVKLLRNKLITNTSCWNNYTLILKIVMGSSIMAAKLLKNKPLTRQLLNTCVVV